MTIARCVRCDRRYRGAEDWNATMQAGVSVGILCPRCQTPQENAEAVVNEAILFYGVDQSGRITGRAKRAA